MKILKYSVALFILVITIACNNESSKEINKPIVELQENIQNIEITIKGMTFSKVSFEHKIGQFSFDSNKISILDIEKHINGIAGGELYEVTKITEVEKFSDIESKQE